MQYLYNNFYSSLNDFNPTEGKYNQTNEKMNE